MGLIHPGVPETYVLSLKERCGIESFVETGTFTGRTAAWAAGHFAQVVTIELSESHYRNASARLSQYANVRQLLGNSPVLLSELAPSLPPSIIWLDAHWCGGGTAGETAECPLLDEIEALAPCWDRAFVLVDDARYFLAPPPTGHDASQWPGLKQVVDALGAGSARFVACFEDLFVSLPAEGREPTMEYVQAGGGQNRRVLGMAGDSGRRSLIRRIGRRLRGKS